MTHRITTLPSGLRVVSERLEHARSVALGFFVGTGSALEARERGGISHLLEHMLFRGTERYRSREVDELFDSMGAELDAGTDRETTSLQTRVLERHLERALDVMAQMIWHPLLEDLEAEREVVLEEIASYEDDPQERVFDALGEAIFGDHPLGRPVIGNATSVGAIDADHLHAHHAQHYVPANVVVAAAGAVDHDALTAMVARTCAGEGGAVPLSPPPPRTTPRVLFTPKDTEQYHVCIGAPGIAHDDERRFELCLLDNVFGAMASSRLFQEVRERRGLAYSVYSFEALYSRTGEVGIYLGTRPENLREALEVVAAELQRLPSDPAGAAELERSREGTKCALALALGSPTARMGELGHAVAAALPILTIEQQCARLDAVSVEGLRELAHALYDPAGLSVAAIGPGEARLREALAPLHELGLPEPQPIGIAPVAPPAAEIAPTAPPVRVAGGGRARP
ncbi:MAG: insulinase family protein [Solirubrobacterales bacterium]|nr:insulinase family protein [Solirubrobacterales bacterium]